MTGLTDKYGDQDGSYLSNSKKIQNICFSCVRAIQKKKEKKDGCVTISVCALSDKDSIVYHINLKSKANKRDAKVKQMGELFHLPNLATTSMLYQYQQQRYSVRQYMPETRAASMEV